MLLAEVWIKTATDPIRALDAVLAVAAPPTEEDEDECLPG